ncbi:HAMP domain-containing sensor histidine kinase [Bacteroides sp. 224]|uniref:sensor histidine kinase n=1 Tax=Bacteroides sp. 224 TaxID=2302936 RepID=UPI0013D55C92|nr:HAMP domain-containing sensor histidine kinase [Bacteroides sp. 224]NDV64862.1 sensor histidine kinase [Bacteroides sp. 224]
MSKSFKQFFSLDRKLFFSVIGIFIIFVGCFIAYQYQREKIYKIALLDIRLQDYNNLINLEIQQHHQDSLQFEDYANVPNIQHLRITIINFNGDVLYDSFEGAHIPDNHQERKEVSQALKSGKGYDVRRLSETTGIQYFYSATRYQNYVVRTALPYSSQVQESLKIDMHYIWFSIVIALTLILIFYKLTRRLGNSISKLKEFALRIEHNEPFNLPMQSSSSDELGEISQHIMQIYQRLHETKEELYIERDKLIAHLQTSREGLGVFDKDKKEILVNNLFIQYTNIISDYNMETTEEVFGILELQPVTDFINKGQKRRMGKDEKRMSLTINKSGRTFMIECIIFQDQSFEISINDVTQEEEQTILKRQLTQNIAHELKTPVSSIQAYLETIIYQDVDPEKQKAFLTRCYEQSNRLTRLLRDISVLTRMDEAANMLEMEKVDISQVVDTIINEVSLELERKKITATNHIRKDIHIRGNYSLIYSAFRNLMDNSIAYAGTEIQIIVNCFREDDSFYYFSFADTGIGVGSEHLQRLFERFYRIDKGRSRKLGGTGLGLAIVKNAILIHGGKISAKQNQGGGLEFIFTLAKDK